MKKLFSLIMVLALTAMIAGCNEPKYPEVRLDPMEPIITQIDGCEVMIHDIDLHFKNSGYTRYGIIIATAKCPGSGQTISIEEPGKYPKHLILVQRQG